MIIKVKIQLYDKDMKLRSTEEKDVEVNSSWYTAQIYFNDNYKSELIDDNTDLQAVVLKWQNKNYVFKRK
jgi:hypothetical protein